MRWYQLPNEGVVELDEEHHAVGVGGLVGEQAVVVYEDVLVDV